MRLLFVDVSSATEAYLPCIIVCIHPAKIAPGEICFVIESKHEKAAPTWKNLPVGCEPQTYKTWFHTV